jgi:hypothetical protein
MRRFSLVVAAVPLTLLGVGLAPLAAQGSPDVEAKAEATPPTKGEKRLAKLLEGRAAGQPVNCIRTFPRDRMQTIDRTAYVYGSGNTIYVQRTNAPDSIDDSDALVIRRYNATQLCRVDIATTIDPVTGIFSGAVFFDDFVPYTRVKDDQPGEG